MGGSVQYRKGGGGEARVKQLQSDFFKQMKETQDIYRKFIFNDRNQEDAKAVLTAYDALQKTAKAIRNSNSAPFLENDRQLWEYGQLDVAAMTAKQTLGQSEEDSWTLGEAMNKFVKK